MSIEFEYLFEDRQITRTPDDIQVMEPRLYESNDLEAVLDEAPLINSFHPSILGIVLNSIKVTPESHNRSRVELQYGARKPSNNNRPITNSAGEVWEWLMVSQMQHIVAVEKEVAIDGGPDRRGVEEYVQYGNIDPKNGKLINYPRTSRTTPAASDLIGQTDTGVQGVDVYRATGGLRVTKEFDDVADANQEYRQALYGLQACVNEAAWVDWQKEEILFLGANIRYSVDSVSAEFNFLFGKTKETATFRIAEVSGSSLSTRAVEFADVKPFQYLWQEPIQALDIPGGDKLKASKRTLQKNAKRVNPYKVGDFELLGLSGPSEEQGGGT